MPEDTEKLKKKADLTRDVAPFRFLDLPGELRNRVYSLANDLDAFTKIVRVRPAQQREPGTNSQQLISPLAGASRQIHSELCSAVLSRLQAKIHIEELEKWISTFYPDIEDYTNSPKILIVEIEDYFVSSLQYEWVGDILPLIYMRTIGRKQVKFVGIDGTSKLNRPSTMLAQLLNELVALDNAVWKHDILHQKLSKVFISRAIVRTFNWDEAFHALVMYKPTTLPANLPTLPNQNRIYMERTGLRTIECVTEGKHGICALKFYAVYDLNMVNKARRELKSGLFRPVAGTAWYINIACAFFSSTPTAEYQIEQ